MAVYQNRGRRDQKASLCETLEVWDSWR
jgi:hypothetical protein